MCWVWVLWYKDKKFWYFKYDIYIFFLSGSNTYKGYYLVQGHSTVPYRYVMTKYLHRVKKNYFYERVVILLLCISAWKYILKLIILILLVRIISSKLFTSLFLTLQYFVYFFQPISCYSKKNCFSWTVCLDYFLFNETNYSSIK